MDLDIHIRLVIDVQNQLDTILSEGLCLTLVLVERNMATSYHNHVKVGVSIIKINMIVYIYIQGTGI